MPLAFPDIPFRVRIGITGHRALQEPERIAAAIRGVLDTGIWELFDPPVLLENRSTRLAFTVLTPLAEGADRLVAKEILNSPDAVIEVVLPFAEDDYLSDFAEAASKAEFEELCRKARRVTVLKPPAPRPPARAPCRRKSGSALMNGSAVMSPTIATF